MTQSNTQTILALDTSSDMLCCAVARVASANDKVKLLSSGDHMCRRHANEELTSTALAALDDAGLSMADVDGVLVGRGPGSFTGVRIGVATAKGLSCGLSKPLYGASTLDATAWTAWLAGVRGILAVVLDAMRGEVYPGIYELDNQGVRRAFASETVQKIDACVAEWAARSDRDELFLTGNGLVKYQDKFEAADFWGFLRESVWFPTAEALVWAWARDTAGRGESPQNSGDPALVLPVYTRLSDAEENERQRLGMAAPASVEVTGVADELANMHLQLRPMSVNDVEQVAALEAAAFVDGVHTPWTRAMFEEELAQPGSTWWVAHDMGTIVGFAGAMLAGDVLDVLDIAVDKDHRRQGIARRLLQRLAYDGHVLGAQAIALEVSAGNDAARALYESLGLSVAGTRRNYYGRGNDAVVMRADLPLVFASDLAQPEPQASIRPWPPVAAPRDAQAQERLAAAAPLILAIESSCDETAMAIIDGQGRIVSNVVATQIDFHARFGGVVPEIASRKHTEAIVGVYEETLARAGQKLGVDTLVPTDLAAVGVTAGPGLVGALVVGVAFAKGLCAAADLPLIAVNHLEGHLLANLFETPDLEPPFVASLVSGGNTMLVHVRDWGDYELLGATIDDAVGEAFDKVAKALGLGYPGGPVISKLSAKGNPRAIAFPRAMMHSGDYRFSLSGLKTAVITYIQGENKAGKPINLPDLAASFEAAVIDVQVSKAVRAIEETGADDFCVGGGVAANPKLREAYKVTFGKQGVRVTVPPFAACGDNGAMIALAALRSYNAGLLSDLSLDAAPNAKLGTWTCDLAPTVWHGEQDWLKP
ncbi:MAG: tRNA (adenosine(37)-N6)-threonylcarbamoyltransferase complex transferase subunit TsaD [Atopobiaceae bacterium]|nr:tRNA (adenosine(37)-N6)-threonylcarbamoyltransferase complex transferase subunit TsaD [Atopobiaceae bacterium]